MSSCLKFPGLGVPGRQIDQPMHSQSANFGKFKRPFSFAQPCSVLIRITMRDCTSSSLHTAAPRISTYCTSNLHSSVAGVGQDVGGPARLHRPPEHPGEQVLQHDAEQQRGGEAVERRNIDQLSVIDIVQPKPPHISTTYTR